MRPYRDGGNAWLVIADAHGPPRAPMPRPLKPFDLLPQQAPQTYDVDWNEQDPTWPDDDAKQSFIVSEVESCGLHCMNRAFPPLAAAS